MTVLFGPIAARTPHTDGGAIAALVACLRAGELCWVRDQMWVRPAAGGEILVAPRCWRYDLWTDDRPLHGPYARLKELERDPLRCFSAARWRAHLSAYPDLDDRSRDAALEAIARARRDGRD